MSLKSSRTQNRRFSSTVACCSCEQSELTTTGPDQSNPIKWEYNWDRKKEEYEKNQVLKKKGVIRQIVMVRHGQYDHSYGDDDLNPLTPLGREQASLTGKRIAELVRAGIIYPIRDVKYSTMLRATQTFEKILPSLDSDPNTLPTHRIQPCSMIREGAVCRPDPPSAGWHPTDDDFLKDEARVEAAFLQYFHRADADILSSPAEDTNNDNSKTQVTTKGGHYSTLLVCHGNVIRYLTMRALQLPPGAWLRTAVYNGSITVIDIHASGTVSLRCLGETGHLPVDFITYS